MRKKQPNFLIVGAMKCATSSLHVQLSRQAGFFMSTPKEPNFFSDNEPYAKGVDWYDALFADTQDCEFVGESSTHYTKLPTHPETLARMQDYFSTPPKIIFVIRHPVERLVSQYIHEWSQNVITEDINSAIETHSELLLYSQYHMQIAPYLKAFGKANVLLVPFVGLKQCPQQTLQRICRFLGHQGDVMWHSDAAKVNASAERIRHFPFYSLLVESSIAMVVRRALVPKWIRHAIKSRLVMDERPLLSSESYLKLQQVFDVDLGKLGGLLGVELNCENFNQVTLETPLEWT